MADQILKVVSALLISPVIIHTLGLESYGEWLLAASIAGYLEMLDFGFSQSAVRFYARTIGSANTAGQQSFFKFLHRHYVGLGILIMLLSAGLAGFGFLQTGISDTPSVILMISVLGFSTGASFIFRPHATLLRARLEYGKVIGAGLGRLLIFTVAIWYWGTGGFGLWMLLLLQSGLQLVEQIVLYGWARSLVPKEAGASLMNREQKSEFLQYACQCALGGLSSALRQRVDTQLLGNHTTPYHISQYAMGLRLPTLFFDVLNALFGGHFVAGFAQLAGAKDDAKLQAALFKTLRLSASASAAGMILLVVLGPPFLEIWIGRDFAPAHEVLVSLTISMALVGAQYPVFPFLGAVNAYGKAIYAGLITSAMNFMVSWILVQKIGLMGVVWGTVAEYVILGLICFPMLAAGPAGVSVRKYLKVVFIDSMLPLIGVMGAGAAALSLLPLPSSYSELTVFGMALAGLAAPAFWWLVLSSPERVEILNLIRSRWPLIPK